MQLLGHAHQLSTCDICYVISSIVKVLRATSKIIVLQRAISFLPSQIKCHLSESFGMQCNFSSLPWDWDCHQNPGKQIWILHVADLCQDRFGWVMLRYFLLFPLIFMWDDFCLESHNITNFVLIKKGSSWKTDHDRNGSDTFHYQLDDRGKETQQ